MGDPFVDKQDIETDASSKRRLIVQCKDARCPWQISAYGKDVKTIPVVTISYRTTSWARLVALASRCCSPKDSYANLLVYCVFI
ncbi:hypothetical protein DVH24_001524 [Malus domestica]|uniref:Uncharacterized protein n=1 Tax=Malus domestica TaxID=3750 RepID=A0A498JZF7_MALDO|nr:hypothetical protein DVH24_001524 [Malus domestica]